MTAGGATRAARAHHEAAHAVVAFYFGCTVEGIWIEETPGGWRGAVDLPLDRTEPHQIRAHVNILLAGAVGEAIYVAKTSGKGRRKPAEYLRIVGGSIDDTRRAWARLKHVYDADEVMRKELGGDDFANQLFGCMAELEAFLSSTWPAVRRIAERLMSSKKIGAEEFRLVAERLAVPREEGSR